MSRSERRWDSYRDLMYSIEELADENRIPKSDDRIRYESMLNSLPEGYAEFVQHESDDAHAPKDISHRWCLCDMPEGEFPRIRMFSSLASLTDMLSRLEGHDTAVSVLYGIPIELTKPISSSDKQNDRKRYLLLPNGTAAVVSVNESFRILDQSELPSGIAVEDTGWLGDQVQSKSHDFYTPGIIDDSIADSEESTTIETAEYEEDEEDEDEEY